MRWLPTARERMAWIAYAMVGAVALWLLTVLAVGDGGRMLGYINAGGFWFGAAALVAGVVLGVRRVWIGAGVALAVVIGVFAQGGFALGLGKAGEGGGMPVRVVTASLRNGNDDMAGAVRILLAQRPDVLVVQEADFDPFFAALTAQGGADWRYVTRKHELIACRCAIVQRPDDTQFLSADLTLGGRRLRVWNVRAPKAYGATFENREFFHALAADIAETSGPGIAAGDYNATPWNDGYRIVARVADDTWRSAGFGPGFTFPAKGRRSGALMPVIQIDHVFVRGGVATRATDIFSAGDGADHYAIAADLVLTGG